MLKKIILFTFTFTNILHLSGQKIITDTILVKFKTDTIISSNYYIDTIYDNRNTHSKVLSYSQKKRYLLIPTDQEICLKKPLSFYLKQPSANQVKDTIALDIDYFIIEKYQGRFFNQYRLYADFPFYKKTQDSLEFKGTMVYNYEYQPKKRKTPQDKAIEELLPYWHQQFKIDLLATTTYLQNGKNKPDVFIEKKLSKPYFLQFTLGSVISYNFWQIDGELFILRPETLTAKWFISSIVRYQKTNDFETFSYGKKSEHYSKRLSESWNFDISSNILLGFVKHSNNDDIKIYQLIQASISSAQCLEFSKKNKSGFLFKTGLFENFNYIVEKPGFQAGIYLSAGYKF